MSGRAYIFDLDGTLVDSAADVLLALCDAFRDCGVDPPAAIDSTAIGPPIRHILRKVYPEGSEADHERIAKAFRRVYDEGPMSSTRVYPGVLEALRLASGRGDPLFVATNKPKKPTARVLGLHLPDIFVEAVSVDSVEGSLLDKTGMIASLVEKHCLEPSKVRVIGDGAGDILAAANQGCRAIGALYGYGSRAELEAAGCREFIHKSEDMPAWMEEDA